MKIPPTGIPLEDIERHALIEALKMSNWVQKDAAELLSISPRVMNYKIKTLGIEFPRGRRAAPLRAADRSGVQLAGSTQSRLGASAAADSASADPSSRVRARGCALPVDLEQLRGVHVRVALVVLSRAWPSSSWIARRSAPRCSRCVANECRSACGLMPARALHAAT